jgi:hypothetical protein
VSASSTAPEEVLGDAARTLQRLRVPFALVGGLAVAARSEVRFTQDVDLAVVRSDDRAVEALVRDMTVNGFSPVVLLEQQAAGRIATVRLRSKGGVVVDLLTASSGIEPEIVERASPVDLEGAGVVPVAQAEELLAMKVLSMRAARPNDRADALALLAVNPSLDLERVRQNLSLIRARGFDRGEDLEAKLVELLAARESVDE